MPLEKKDVEASHRNSGKIDAPIIVKLASRKSREKFLTKKAKSSLKKLSTSDLGFQQEGEEEATQESNGKKIYINESLTRRNKDLLRVTKIKARELEYKYI